MVQIEQCSYNGFLELNLWKELPAVTKNNAMRAATVTGVQILNELKLALKLRKAADLGDNSL